VYHEVRQPYTGHPQRSTAREGAPTEEGHRERGDTDVPEQTQGSGAVYAEEQEVVEAGGDTVCDRLHL